MQKTNILFIVFLLVLLSCFSVGRAYSQDAKWYQERITRLSNIELEQKFDDLDACASDLTTCLIEQEYLKRANQIPASIITTIFNGTIKGTRKNSIARGAFVCRIQKLTIEELSNLFGTLHPDDQAGWILACKLGEYKIKPLETVPLQTVLEYLFSYDPQENSIEKRWWYPQMQSLLSRLSTPQIIQLKAKLPPLHPLCYQLDKQLEMRDKKKAEQTAQLTTPKPIVHPLEIIRPNQPPEIVDGDTYNAYKAFAHPVEIGRPNHIPQIVDGDTYYNDNGGKSINCQVVLMNYFGNGFSASRPEMDLDLVPYMNDLRRCIKREWFPPTKRGNTLTTLSFKLYKSGIISDLVIYQSSGSHSTDQSALKAIANSVPFKPLPLGLEDISIQLIFNYGNASFIDLSPQMNDTKKDRGTYRF